LDQKSYSQQGTSRSSRDQMW